MPSAAQRKPTPAATKRAPARPELFQDILVHQDESDASRTALHYADALASAADGNLSALMFGILASYPVSIYMEATPDIWLSAQRQADAEADALEAKVRDRCAAVGSAPELRRMNVMGGEAGQMLASQAHYADIVIIGINGGGPDYMQRGLFEAVLFYSGRPIILVPEAVRRHGMPRTILIAWCPGREATRALHDALPLLKAADAVHLVVVDEGASFAAYREEEPGVDIGRHLARHGVNVEVRHVPSGRSGTASVILDEARYCGADLIVMGGYGHSRMREWILGGATRDILTMTKLPVLMAQ
jgi:nucleotide-binding universal stress UspA family protein